jgi:hypothetical protein
MGTADALRFTRNRPVKGIRFAGVHGFCVFGARREHAKAVNSNGAPRCQHPSVAGYLHPCLVFDPPLLYYRHGSRFRGSRL